MSGKKRLLWIDDDKDLISVGRVALEAEGFQVDCAHDGRSGLEMALRTPPDAVILDVSMASVGEGFDVARRLREEEATADVPILMLTAINRPNLPYKYGPDETWNPVDAFLDKPITPPALVDAVKNLFKRTTA
ncbi:MAG: response regulator [Planctomycetes bacterium]|nr:response regulator [Planctomycetota bacterium]